MESIIQIYLEQVRIGRRQSYRNLSVYPLLSGYAADLDYMTLDEALALELIEIREKDEAGSVPELRVVNTSPTMVLILDGEELVGAKQNRIVNTTILLEGKSTTVIPVSCVEQGRWAYDSRKFSSRKRFMSAQLRAAKAEQVHRSVRTSESFRSDQGAIWDEISRKAARMEAASPTMAMADIYEQKRSSLSGYTKHFRAAEMQVGALFLINDRVVGLDSFGRPDTFAKVFKKLVESYALDAIDWFGEESPARARKSQASEFLKVARTASIESRASVGLGTDIRLEADKVAGFALAFDGQILHLSIFARGNGHRAGRRSSGMQRFSRRRGSRG
jgi:hypothetical protein